MGGLQSIKNKFYGRKKIRVLILGLDAAGKTTILYRLKLGETITTISTIGFNVETFNHDRLIITAWDIGGGDKIRPLYRHYYQNTGALIYIVDSNDRERIEQSKEELESYVLKDDEVKGIPLLIMANKQDLQNAMSVSEITDAMDLHNSCRDRKWHVQGCCATTGEGLMEGIDWLHEIITGKAVKEAIVN